MEMINRYVYAVTNKLPERQRKDVADELFGLIEDMIDDRVQGRDVMEKDIEEVLLELGQPTKLSRKYKGSKSYIIGPELYDLYMLILKTGVISIVAIISAIFVFQTILNPINTINYFGNFIVSFVISVPIFIGWTTIGFALTEYFRAGKLGNIAFGLEWEPSHLKPVPNRYPQIKRNEPITGIILYVFAMVLLAFFHEYIGIWMFQDGDFLGVIPFLNEETYALFKVFIIIVLVFAIVKECLKFIYEKWTLKLVVMTTFVNLLSIALLLFMIKGPPFWNPSFMNELVQHGFVNKGSDGFTTVRLIWEKTTLWTLIIFIIGLSWDVIVDFIKFPKGK